jgi:cytochrome c
MRALATMAVLAAMTGVASAAGPPLVEEGRLLVEAYCADCHAIEPAGASPHPDAPPFRTLHERYDVEWLSEALVEGLVTGHPDMPEFDFDPIQAEAIVEYLKSLE